MCVCVGLCFVMLSFRVFVFSDFLFVIFIALSGCFESMVSGDEGGIEV